MGVGYHRPNVAELRVRLFDRPLHPEWFGVRGHRRVSGDRWEADVRIVDGGHVVHWRCGPVVLTEVLCGSETYLPRSGCLLTTEVEGEQSLGLDGPAEVAYQVSLDVERVDRALFSHLSQEIEQDRHRGLFDRHWSRNRMEDGALSLVRIDSLATGLSIHAIHSFPSELALVRVQSLFEHSSSTE